MKQVKIILSLLFFCQFFNINAQKLSNKAEIYVLVCSPGVELYQAFGHNAFWIIDSVKHINNIYHYGTFNYNDPNFYLKFIRGRLDYMLSTESYRGFISEYTNDKRDVWKLKLNITNQQKNWIYKYLQWKRLEANKYYKYDFFMDNCATRVRDVLENTYGDSLKFASLNLDKSYRQAIKPYLRAKPWTRFGINLLLGLPADKKMNYYSAMFLPDYIDSVFNKSKLVFEGKSENLTLKRDYMIKSDFKIGEKPIFNPSLTFWFISIIIAAFTFIGIKKKKLYKSIDFVYYFLTGLVGILLIFMWFGTDHSPTKWNLNLIWAFPLHIYFAFVYLKQNKLKFIKIYSLIFSIINLLLIISFPFFPQQFDVALIPLLLVFAGRMFYIYRFLS